MLMSSQDYRDSLRRSQPRVYVDGQQLNRSPTSRRWRPVSTRSV